MMNNSETQPMSFNAFCEKVREQARASQGNMGDASPVLPAYLRGQMNKGEPVSILKHFSSQNSPEENIASSSTGKAEDSSS